MFCNSRIQCLSVETNENSAVLVSALEGGAAGMTYSIRWRLNRTITIEHVTAE